MILSDEHGWTEAENQLGFTTTFLLADLSRVQTAIQKKQSQRECQSAVPAQLVTGAHDRLAWEMGPN